MDKKRIRERLNEKVYKDSGLGAWFGSGGKGGKGGGGWDRYNEKGERIGKCGDSKESEGKPKCLSKEKAAKMTKAEIAAAVRRKRKKDPQKDRPGTGNKPINVSNKIKKEETMQNLNIKNIHPEMVVVLNEKNCVVRSVNRVGDLSYCLTFIDENKKIGKEFFLKNDYVFVSEEFESIDLQEEKETKKKLNKPFRTPGGPKKFSVYVKNDKGNVVKVNFGDPNMEIKRDDPKRRKSFRARHNCDNPGPKTKARYWSCHQWRGGQKVEDDFKPSGEMLQEKEEKKEIPEKVKKIAKELDAAVKMHTSQAKRLRDAGISEETSLLAEENVPTNPSLWSRAKSLARKKFDVYPSAYANAWASKWYKKKGGGWKKKSKKKVNEGYLETKKMDKQEKLTRDDISTQLGNMGIMKDEPKRKKLAQIIMGTKRLYTKDREEKENENI